MWYANALRGNPNFNDAIRNLAHLGQKGIQDNQPQTSIKALELLIQYQQKPEYFNQLAEAYGKSGIDLAKSESYLQRSLELDPNNADTYQWQDGSTNPTYNITQSGLYSVTVTNECNSICLIKNT